MAPNLQSFWRGLLSLNIYYNDSVGYVGSSASGEEEPDDEQVEVIQSRVIDRIRTWRQTQAENGISDEDLTYLSELLGVALVSDAEAVVEMFTCDFTAPRWRPRSLDDDA